jgi:alginate O-acetyltransferase complex protein AlgI
MLFTSRLFLGFFVLICVLYLLLRRRHKAQNLLLLAAGYFFYGYWDWRFLVLLAGSTVVDYLLGPALAAAGNAKQKKSLLLLSILFNLGVLGFFKYFNFFAENFAALLRLLGMDAGPVTLHVLLPLGISFYTFQKMTYVLDIYRGTIRPTRNLLDFALFVSFLPTVLSGPIERAATLLPQIQKTRRVSLDDVNAGLFLLLWGYFKKVVIADNLARIADPIFAGYAQHQGLDITIGILAATVQIYCDFSGYTDIARGLARLLGFNLMLNFKLPYLALNPGDFWRRWHISLYSWLRDYLWWPMAKNLSFAGKFISKLKWSACLFFVFFVSGWWHGAAWNYIIWGAYQGVLIVLYQIYDKHPEHEDPWGGRFPYYRVLAKMALMLVLTMIGWVVFKSTSATQIVSLLTSIGPTPSGATAHLAGRLLFFALPLVAVQIHQYVTQDLLALTKTRLWIQIPVYVLLIVGIFIFGVREATEFIYFQF